MAGWVCLSYCHRQIRSGVNKKDRNSARVSLVKKFWRSRFLALAIGKTLAAWLRFVHNSARMQNDSDKAYARVEKDFPAIIALWHGQHFLVPLVRKKDHPVRALVSRSGDGEINSILAKSMNVEVVRGSGGRNRSKTLSKGGIAALKALVGTLAEGISVVMTVNVPKGGARECGMGVITLAKLSGRPVVPAAYASDWRIDLDSWDKASVNLPFSRAAFFIGDPIFVPRDADPETLEQARIAVEEGLNRVTQQAYAAAQGKSVEKQLDSESDKN